uniref:Uncharacterized protein n=1 Tax=Caenorhabditis tropicalis TaxID=1561998 RepID=A0A1I7TEI9_9PELO
MSFLAIPMPFSRNSQSSTPQSPACLDNDPNCDLMRFLLALVGFIGFIAIFICAGRAITRLFRRKSLLSLLEDRSQKSAILRAISSEDYLLLPR